MTTKMEVFWSKLNKFPRNRLGFCKGNLDVKQVKSNENQGLYSNQVVKNLFDKQVHKLRENGFSTRENIQYVLWWKTKLRKLMGLFLK